VRFTRKDLRAATGWGDTQLRVHLERLVSLEYLIVHRGQRFDYELLYDGDGGAAPHLSGLIDVATITNSRGRDPPFAACLRVTSGPLAARLHDHESTRNPLPARGCDDSPLAERETHGSGGDLTYPHAVPLAAAAAVDA
jgi:hypothetical protein